MVAIVFEDKGGVKELSVSCELRMSVKSIGSAMRGVTTSSESIGSSLSVSAKDD
jgi:hypothetical protein